MRKALFLALAMSAAGPALAEGFNLTQLVQANFKLMAAVSNGAREILYLQGRLPGGSYEVIMRCVARPDAEEGVSNCEQVY